MPAVSAGGPLLGRENVSPCLSEWKAEVRETLVVQEWLEFAGVSFLLETHSGKHKAPGPSAGCETGEFVVSWGFGGWFGLVSEAFLSHASFGQLGMSKN